MTQPQTPAIIAPNGPFAHSECPTSTPWGRAQDTSVLMWGVSEDGTRIPVLWQVYTAGHGGTRVHRELAARFLNGIPKACHAFGGSRLWYEEDCESTVPLFIFYNGLAPSCWLVAEGKQYPREKLLESVQRWMPETVNAVRALAARFDDALVRQGSPLRTALQSLKAA